ncbi:hypothetical protein B484DRAFT_484134, partial [Ochromonadaceae sp. CCMP2298]
MYSEADVLELARRVRADPSKRLTAGKVAKQFINSRSPKRGQDQEKVLKSLSRKIDYRLKHSDHLLAPAPVAGPAAGPVTLSTELWRARVMLMRMENLRLRKMEETERLRKREEEAREQSERLGMREQEEEEQGERLAKRKEEARAQAERLRKRKEETAKLSYSAVINSSLHHRNIVRNRVLLAEDLQAYINLGEWGHVLPQKEIRRCAEHCSKAASTGLEYRLKGMSGGSTKSRNKLLIFAYAMRLVGENSLCSIAIDTLCTTYKIQLVLPVEGQEPEPEPELELGWVQVQNKKENKKYKQKASRKAAVPSWRPKE